MSVLEISILVAINVASFFAGFFHPEIITCVKGLWTKTSDSSDQ